MIDNLNVRITLMARRMHYRNGSRYNCRGMDDGGHVANELEKE